MHDRRIFLVSLGLLMFMSVDATAASGAATARAFMGIENGVALSVENASRTAGLELSQSFLPKRNLGSLTEAAITVGTARQGGWVGGRLGYQLGIFSYDGAAARDITHAADLDAVIGWTGERGHTISLEAGIERVLRGDAFHCCDSTGKDASTGARVVLGGEVVLGERTAIFGRLGVRTADHLLEIHLLPVFEAGLSLRF